MTLLLVQAELWRRVRPHRNGRAVASGHRRTTASLNSFGSILQSVCWGGEPRYFTVEKLLTA
jgi:hypothetical protein